MNGSLKSRCASSIVMCRTVRSPCFHSLLTFLYFSAFQVDLHGWMHPLNVMDSALSWILNNYAKQMLLLPPFADTTKEQNSVSDKRVHSIEDVYNCPTEILQHCATILQFSACLLRNAVSKNLYASVSLVSDLLASADDEISDHALSVLSALSLPPALHKQQRPDHQLHTTQLHQASGSPFAAASAGPINIHRTDVHDRLMATARAWGTRAMGFGLYNAVTVDDWIHGQGCLPTQKIQAVEDLLNQTVEESLGRNLEIWLLKVESA